MVRELRFRATAAEADAVERLAIRNGQSTSTFLREQLARVLPGIFVANKTRAA